MNRTCFEEKAHFSTTRTICYRIHQLRDVVLKYERFVKMVTTRRCIRKFIALVLERRYRNASAFCVCYVIVCVRSCVCVYTKRGPTEQTPFIFVFQPAMLLGYIFWLSYRLVRNDRDIYVEWKATFKNVGLSCSYSLTSLFATVVDAIATNLCQRRRRHWWCMLCPRKRHSLSSIYLSAPVYGWNPKLLWPKL